MLTFDLDPRHPWYHL